MLCGHSIHQRCYYDHVKTYAARNQPKAIDTDYCPEIIAVQPVQNLCATWKAPFACLIIRSPCNSAFSQKSRRASVLTFSSMPLSYKDTTARISCNDCGSKSTVAYHFLGHKCTNCMSYNTVILSTSNHPHE